MSLNFQAIVDLLKKLRANKPSTPKFKILVTILKSFLSQEIPDFHTAASTFETLNNISTDSQISARSTSNAIYLEYQLQEEDVRNNLGKPPRLLIDRSSFKYYTQLKGYYRIQISEINPEFLGDETQWKKVFDLFEPTEGTKIFLIPQNTLTNSKSSPRRSAIGFYRVRPPIIDYIDDMKKLGIAISVRYLNRTEAQKEKLKREQKETPTKESNGRDSTTNENENESKNKRKEKENQNETKVPQQEKNNEEENETRTNQSKIEIKREKSTNKKYTQDKIPVNAKTKSMTQLHLPQRITPNLNNPYTK
jgi:hypothetical protein